MRKKCVKVKVTTVTVKCRGKSGVQHEVVIADKRLARIVKRVQDLPGQDLFGYCDENEEVRHITSQDVNDYLREITGEDFTAKDFRTWAGTVLAAVALSALDPFQTKKEATKNVTTAVKAVAKILGNTPAVCRKCYVHPAVLETYLSGGMIEGLRRKTAEALEEKVQDLQTVEVAVMQFLQGRLTELKKA